MRVKLGEWRFPSGNHCEVSLEKGAGVIHDLHFEWDSPPPLSREDHQYYEATMRPAGASAVRQRLFRHEK
jgi:hypothetical protein